MVIAQRVTKEGGNVVRVSLYRTLRKKTYLELT